MRAGVALEEVFYQVQDRTGNVFEDIMPCVRETVDLGQWEPPLPFGEVIAVEHEVTLPPADQRGFPSKLI